MFWAFLSTICYAGRSIFSKRLANKNVSAIYTQWIMRVYGLLIIFVFLLINKTSISDFTPIFTDHKVLLFVLISNFAGFIGLLLSIYIMKFWDISSLAPMNSLMPLLTGLTAFLMLGERFKTQGSIGIAMIILSAFFLLAVDNGRNVGIFFKNILSVKTIGLLSSMVLFALSVVSYKMISSDLTIFAYITSLYVINIILSSLLLLFVEKKPVKEWIKFDKDLILVAVFATFAIIFNNVAYKNNPAALVSTIQQTEIFIVMLFGIVILGEQKNKWIKAVTGATAFCGICVMTFAG